MSTSIPAAASMRAEFRDLLPTFLENRRKDIETVNAALAADDFDTIRTVGMNMQGFGRGYGFEDLALLGEWLRKAADAEQPAEVRRLNRRLAQYVATLSSAAEKPPLQAATGRERAGPAQFEVLIVADGEANCQLLAQCLSGEDFIIGQLTSGEQLLETADCIGAPVVVVLDTALGRTDGFEVCRRIKADPASLSVPVLLLTGLDSHQTRLRAIESNADAFLPKPADRRELVARIRSLAEMSCARKQAEEQRLLREVGKHQRLARTFERYLTPKVAQLVLSKTGGDEPLWGKHIRRDAVVLFADLRGFTRMSENLDVERIAGLLNEFIAALMAAATRHGGTVFNMTGDGLLIGFNVPIEQQDASRRALLAACDMMRGFQNLAASWQDKHGIQLGMGIGINCGEVIFGNIGSAEFMSYTMIGDTVNVAARLTDAARAGEIVIGAEMLPVARRHLAGLREESAEPLQLKGKSLPVKVCRISFERLAEAGGAPEMIMPRVLVIDDSADTRALVARLITLEWPGAVVAEWDPVAQGRPGEDFDWTAYDVVFLDYMLGREDGLEWLRRFRRDPACPPVVVFSGANDESLAVTALKCGAMHYLPKRELCAARVAELVGAAMSVEPRAQPPAAEQATARLAEATLPAPAAAGTPGDPQIPGYCSVSLLGRGGMSTTYLARRNRDGAQVVLKILDQELAGNRELELRFMREASMICGLSSPYVVRILDQGITGVHMYLAMEHMAGGDLKQRIWAGITPVQALEIIYKLAHALNVIHEAGIVHRDIKPANIMFRADGSLALIDFGIAKEAGEVKSLTTPGSTYGTPNYISPEQCLGLPADARSDIYSLGVVFYEMLTRKKPYPAESAGTEPPLLLPGKLSVYQPLLAKMIANDPAQRFQSARELSSAILDSFAAHGGTSVQTRTVPAAA